MTRDSRHLPLLSAISILMLRRQREITIASCISFQLISIIAQPDVRCNRQYRCDKGRTPPRRHSLNYP
jgi:hypothetical protein